jgi:hypothetical protein
MALELDEYLEPQVGVAVAATAIVLSPPVRRVARRGLVYGLAGALVVGDAVASFLRGVTQGLQGGEPAAPASAEGSSEAP